MNIIYFPFRLNSRQIIHFVLEKEHRFWKITHKFHPSKTQIRQTCIIKNNHRKFNIPSCYPSQPRLENTRYMNSTLSQLSSYRFGRVTRPRLLVTSDCRRFHCYATLEIKTLLSGLQKIPSIIHVIPYMEGVYLR